MIEDLRSRNNKIFNVKKENNMTANRILGKDSIGNPKREVNKVMEQNPSEKTELMSVKGADAKPF
jgi:hypothetical protein